MLNQGRYMLYVHIKLFDLFFAVLFIAHLEIVGSSMKSLVVE